MDVKKFLCLITAIIILSCPAYADEENLTEQNPYKGFAKSFMIQRDLNNAIGFKTYDGLQVLYMGTFRNEQPTPVEQPKKAKKFPHQMKVFYLFLW